MRTMIMFIILCVCILTVNGVFGDEVKSVSVVEGDSVILYTDTVKQTDDVIMWYYGPNNTLVARINGKASTNKLAKDERFKDRVKLDDRTGDLIITNTTTQHTGLYTLDTISRNKKIKDKKFNVTVYAHLPVPVISSNSSQCSSSSSSSSRCVLLCSVMNVRDVSLSWYKGNSLLSSISVSDLNIRLSLPLEVEYQDTNTYSCVLNNTITKQTQLLNITQLCQMCSDTLLIILICCGVGVSLMILAGVPFFCVYRKHKAGFMKATTNYSDEESSTNSSSTFEDGEASRFMNEQQKSDMHELPD
ncbi:natural killer cell receptor 2B4-like isoform X3 [Paramisgurnus dabryanus]|uniref:natural killer cell receptor 2B4-like isoform X3 n=1 Tax=Paramisgurnus dabryanus TaxID=90735 RepID=UPI0031F46C5C